MVIYIYIKNKTLDHTGVSSLKHQGLKHQGLTYTKLQEKADLLANYFHPSSPPKTYLISLT